MKNNLLNKKKEFRKKQFIKRRKLFDVVKKKFNEKLFDDLFERIDFKNINIISTFISINTEISTSELNNYILKKNKKLCLPVVLNKDEHLLFRRFTNDQAMIEGFMKIKEPPNSSEVLIPELLIVP